MRALREMVEANRKGRVALKEATVKLKIVWKVPGWVRTETCVYAIAHFVLNEILVDGYKLGKLIGPLGQRVRRNFAQLHFCCSEQSVPCNEHRCYCTQLHVCDHNYWLIYAHGAALLTITITDHTSYLYVTGAPLFTIGTVTDVPNCYSAIIWSD